MTYLWVLGHKLQQIHNALNSLFFFYFYFEILTKLQKMFLWYCRDILIDFLLNNEQEKSIRTSHYFDFWPVLAQSAAVSVQVAASENKRFERWAGNELAFHWSSGSKSANLEHHWMAAGLTVKWEAASSSHSVCTEPCKGRWTLSNLLHGLRSCLPSVGGGGWSSSRARRNSK